MAKLEIDNLSVNYGGRGGAETLALSQVNLTMERGDFVVALGASGCGKTTLLSCIAGFMQPSEGEIRLDGKTVHGPGAERGVVFQKHALMPWLNVLDNVALGLRLRGVPRAERLRIAQEKLALVGLEKVAAKPVYQLSGGMQQRVGIARTLANDPAVMLMDEPLGALDALTRLEMHELIESLWRRQGFTALLVTHDVSEAVALADRVLLIEEGRIALDLQVKLPHPRRRGDVRVSEIEARILERVLHPEIEPLRKAS